MRVCGFRVRDMGVWRLGISYLPRRRSRTRGGRPARWWRRWMGGIASGEGATRVVEDSRCAGLGRWHKTKRG